MGQRNYMAPKCISGENVPKQWKMAYITSKHKGNNLECNNHSGISAYHMKIKTMKRKCSVLILYRTK